MQMIDCYAYYFEILTVQRDRDGARRSREQGKEGGKGPREAEAEAGAATKVSDEPVV